MYKKFLSPASQLVWQQWLAGAALCKLFKFLQTYSLAASNFMLVCLALVSILVLIGYLVILSNYFLK